MIEDLRLFGSCAGPKVGGPLRQTWIVDVLALKDFGPVKPILGSQDILKIIHHADFEREVFSERGIATFMAIHLFLVSKLGIAEPPWSKRRLALERDEEDAKRRAASERIPFGRTPVPAGQPAPDPVRVEADS